MGVAAYLLVLGDRTAIRWVLMNERMAFPTVQRAEVRALRTGDRLFLVSTRGAFRNPTRDRTRLIGTATALGAATALDPPLELTGRTFRSGCRIRLESLTPYLGGPELAPLVPRLAAFDHKEQWGMYLRRPLLTLRNGDADELDRSLDGHATSPSQNLAAYRERIAP